MAGLGPRSYAIIEQGTISRLIEAKPEELRNFIEEAAGISKYKERRRETENRMRRTRENLERLDDIREELDRQLQHLHRQAQAAEKYTQYKEEERIKKAQLQALRWRSVDQQIKDKEALIREAEVEYEKSQADHQHIDTSLEKLRIEYSELNDQFNQVQGKYYGVGAEIGRTEQEIQHQTQRNEQYQRDLAEDQQRLREIIEQIEADKEQLAQLQLELEEIEPLSGAALTTEKTSAEHLANAEEKMNHWQQEWEDYNQKAAEPQQKAQVAQSKIQHLEQSIQRLRERLIRLEREQEGLNFSSIEEEMAELNEEISAQELEFESQQEQLDRLAEEIENIRESNRARNEQIDGLKSQLQAAKGKQASLEALQEAALGEQDDSFQAWLQENGLSSNSRLGEQLQVESGWETAVETVLEPYLQGICTDDLGPILNPAQQIENGRHSFLQRQATATSQAEANADYLVTKVESSVDLGAIMFGVKIAESVEQAFSARADLKAHESLITQSGLWLGRNWIQVGKSQGAQAGMIQRAQELESLAQEIEDTEQAIQQQTQLLEEKRASVREKEQGRDEKQKQLNELNKRVGELKAQSSAKQVRLEQFIARKERIKNDIEEVQEHQEVEQEHLAEARIQLQDALDSMAQDTDRRESLMRQRDETRLQLEQARDKARQDKDEAHHLNLQLHSIKTQIDSTQQAYQRLQAQQQQAQERVETLQANMEDNLEPQEERKARLEQLLEQHVEAEEALAEARRKVESVEHSVREQEKNRAQLEQQSHTVRSKLESLRMEWQGLEVRRKTLQEQLKETQFDLQTVLNNLDEQANEKEWEEELQRIANRIARLGAINLAAIDEYQSESERKTHLDTQHEDLVEALETLENAIKKIDKETRARFKETFDKINKGLQQLFPKVFGGGHAYLELTGDDLLDTGVAIMARPPGKRNSTIHLLSGGEKALTAIALVFSIFQLNPAPFCLLDEVDAPLDDANVGRFCRMVEEMSESVQFIYISHNKIAMEMAQSLMGVTMQEAGVSRLVMVDVDEATAMVAV